MTHLTQRQHNELTKTRLKVKRAATLKDALRELAAGMLRFAALRFAESVIIEGDGWVAYRLPTGNK